MPHEETRSPRRAAREQSQPLGDLPTTHTPMSETSCGLVEAAGTASLTVPAFCD